MATSDRSTLTWRQWDERVHSPREATALLTTAKDEQLLELLAGGSDQDRSHERGMVAIEDRLAKRSLALPGGAMDVYKAARTAHEAALHSQITIHTAGGILKAHGDDELGISISAAALVSLDTTKIAMDAARLHLSELQAALAQSRVAERLILDAAHAALEAAVKAEQGADRIDALGKQQEAEDARMAARQLRAAADEAARTLQGRDESRSR